MRSLVLCLVVLALIAAMAVIGHLLLGLAGALVLGGMSACTGACFGLATYFDSGPGGTLFGLLWGLCAFFTAIAAAVLFVLHFLV